MSFRISSIRRRPVPDLKQSGMNGKFAGSGQSFIPVAVKPLGQVACRGRHAPCLASGARYLVIAGKAAMIF